MLMPHLQLTRRLELHDAWSSAAHAEKQAQLYPETGAAVLSLSSGCAVYGGQNSPLSGVYGWGLDGPVPTVELAAVQAFFRSRGLPVRIKPGQIVVTTMPSFCSSARNPVDQPVSANLLAE